MVLHVKNATILARHFWNHFPSKPVTMGINNNAVYLSNKYTHLRYKSDLEVYPTRYNYDHIILNKLDLFMNDFTLSENTSVSFDDTSRNRYSIHYKLQVINGESKALCEKKLSDMSSLENFDLWHDFAYAKKLREIDELIETNKDCFVSMRK